MLELEEDDCGTYFLESYSQYVSCEIFTEIGLIFSQGIACTKISKARNEGSANGSEESRAYLEKKLVFCFGSYVASQLLLPFGEENVLSSSELKQAQEVLSLSLRTIFLFF